MFTRIVLMALICSGGMCITAQTSLNNSTSSNNSPYIFPLRISAVNRHYLEDQKGRSFFWSGDTSWSLIAQLGRQDVKYYLDDRQKKGFSVLLVNLIEHKFSTSAPSNFYGDSPFAGKAFATPNEKYFTHADFVIRAAGERNMIVLLAPLYLGYKCGDEGWCGKIKSADLKDLRSWGQYLGNRYKDFNNIIWLIGGDTDPLQVKEKVLEVVKGILEFDTTHLFTAHNQPGSFAKDPWENEEWLNLNNVYSYDSLIYPSYKKAYERVPVMPFFEIESTYENEHKSTPVQLRTQAYRAVLCGATGHIFGNCPIWHFGAAPKWCAKDDWKTELNNIGSVSMDYLQRVFRSRAWDLLIPDFNHTVLTRGYGLWGKKDYVTAAYCSDGSSFIGYLPSGREVTVDMSKIKGSKSKCWWYDPSNGSSKHIGTYRNTGSRNFTPGTPGDWVLVIDNADLDLPPPGRQF